MPIHLILYGTYGCHLCELAQELLAQPLAESRVTVDEVDILDDPALEERYGVHIPVIRHAETGTELGWPFDADELAKFLAQLAAR